jgi:hypothetical protein
MSDRAASDAADAATITRLREALDELVRDLPMSPGQADNVDSVAPLVPARARSRLPVAVGAALVACVLIVVGIVALRGNGRALSIKTGPSSSGGGVPTYQLRLKGAELLREQRLTASGSDVLLWGDDDRQTYLSLNVRPGAARVQPEPAGLGPMTEDASFPAREGRAWFGGGTGTESRSMRMWWARPNGDLWLLTAHWYAPPPVDLAARRTQLREWALAIKRPSTPSAAGDLYHLVDPTMRVLAFDQAAERGSRARVWRYRGYEITLLVIEDSAAAGRSNVLALGKPEPVTVGDNDGWIVPRTPAGTIVGWRIGGSRSAWATLTIPAAVADQTEVILRDLAPA